jgi:hypothetical protein
MNIWKITSSVVKITIVFKNKSVGNVNIKLKFIELQFETVSILIRFNIFVKSFGQKTLQVFGKMMDIFGITFQDCSVKLKRFKRHLKFKLHFD